MPVMLERWNDDKMDELSGKVDALGTNVAVLDTKVDALDAKVDALDKRFEQFDHRFHALHRTLITAMVGVPAAYAILSRLVS
ncbi:MAG TPA: hypothetical protein VFM94_07700 [Solirubrobacterales bacterium]|nr:hypothetical protein [Solirubrobacterales bacterium]